MLRIFIGYDARQAVSFNVLAHSLLEHSETPIQIIPLKLECLPITRRGLTPFTYSRFLVPWLCEFQGDALFLDADILCTADIGQILEHARNSEAAVAVCPTDPAYERAAVMLFNCAHPDNRQLDPRYVETTETPLHLIKWTEQIHWLPNRFNFLVGYDDPDWCRGQIPTLVHYTKGVPAWPETANCDYADLWLKARTRAFNPAVNWATLMSSSNHATAGPGGVMPKPRGPDAIREPQRSPYIAPKLVDAAERQ